jgi:hypothetical protein
MADSTFQKSLPNFVEAEIDPEKFYRYSMDPMNIGSQSKWIAFEEIGYNVHDDESRWNAAQNVIEQLKDSLPDVPAKPGKTTQYGQRYQVRTQITGPTGKMGTLVTIWQIDVGNNVPRLITNWLEVYHGTYEKKYPD